MGLFGARNAPGPSALMLILLIVTILYHITLNRILVSLERSVAPNGEEETVPLLAAEEINAESGEGHSSTSESGRIDLLGLPRFVSEAIGGRVVSFVDSARNSARSWINDPSAREGEDEVSYTDEEVNKAYLNPAITSKTPKLWLAKDRVGVSKQEIAENEDVGISTTDDGALFDSENRLRWEQDDLSKVPIFKRPVRY